MNGRDARDRHGLNPAVNSLHNGPKVHEIDKRRLLGHLLVRSLDPDLMRKHMISFSIGMPFKDYRQCLLETLCLDLLET